jgi:hypothetical protein
MRLFRSPYQRGYGRSVLQLDSGYVAEAIEIVSNA